MKRFDRYIRIETQVTVVDPQFGTQTAQWVELGTMWAQIEELEPTSAARAKVKTTEIDVSLRPAEIVVRWHPTLEASLNTRCRVLLLDRGNRDCRVITQPAEMDRRMYYKFLVQDHSTQGDS